MSAVARARFILWCVRSKIHDEALFLAEAEASYVAGFPVPLPLPPGPPLRLD